jgi:hypothetical protein
MQTGKALGAFVNKEQLLQFANEYFEWRNIIKPEEKTRERLRLLLHLTGMYFDIRMVEAVCKDEQEAEHSKNQFVELVQKYAEKCKYYRRFLVPDPESGGVMSGLLPNVVHEYLAQRLEGSDDIPTFKEMMVMLDIKQFVPK